MSKRCVYVCRFPLLSVFTSLFLKQRYAEQLFSIHIYIYIVLCMLYALFVQGPHKENKANVIRMQYFNIKT